MTLVPFAILTAGHPQQTWRLRLTRTVTYLLMVAPLLLFVAWLFNALHGSPIVSGYGTLTGAFAWSHVASNLQRYPRWLWESHGPLVFLFLLAPLFMGRQDAQSRLRAALFAFVALVWAELSLGTRLLKSGVHRHFFCPLFPSC